MGLAQLRLDSERTEGENCQINQNSVICVLQCSYYILFFVDYYASQHSNHLKK